jgi:hypothetical protein
MDALQRKQLELAKLFARLGELDIIAGDIDRERDQVRAAVGQCRAALQVLSVAAPAPPPSLEAVP